VDLTTGAAWQGECREVSEQGIRLVLCRRFEPRTLLWIDLNGCPQAPVGSLLARVVWTEKDGCGRWLIGGTLVHALPPDEVEALADTSCESASSTGSQSRAQAGGSISRHGPGDSSVRTVGDRRSSGPEAAFPEIVERLRQRLRQNLTCQRVVSTPG
jgi:hypothetical protein